MRRCAAMHLHDLDMQDRQARCAVPHALPCICTVIVVIVAFCMQVMNCLITPLSDPAHLLHITCTACLHQMLQMTTEQVI